MSYWERIKSNRLILESFVLLFLFWVFCSILLWVNVSRLNELNHANQQEIITNKAANLLETIEQEVLATERFFEASNVVTEDEFETFCTNHCDDSQWSYLIYAGDGTVDYAFPSDTTNITIGTDLYNGFDDKLLDDLQAAIVDHTLFYQLSANDIVFYKPVIKSDTFMGLIGLAVDREEFATAVVGSLPEQDIQFLLDDLSLTEFDENKQDDVTLESIVISGMEFQIGTTYKSSLFNTTRWWAIIIELLMTLLFGVIFYLMYRYRRQNVVFLHQMDYMKHHHIATGLKNRQSLYEDFQALSETDQSFYVAYGYFNNVKFIHYKFGHDIGDSLEQKAIRLIEGVLRSHSALYHLGGDEYVFLFNTESDSEVRNILKRVLRVFEREIIIKNVRTNISLSLGVVQYPTEGKTIEELIQNASMTLAQSSIRSTNNFAFFSTTIHEDLVSMRDFDNYVNTLDLNQFKVHFMPIASCENDRIFGFECLTRAYNEFQELMSTGDVINSLERSGRIQELDTIVFSKVVAYKVQLDRDLPENDLFLSVNASALSVNEAFVDVIIAIFQESELSDGSVILELTESYKVEDYDYLIRLFKKLNTAGIATSIDDFGSGYSSLSYISKFPIYSIKLDKRYVQDYQDSEFNRTLFFTLRSIAEVIGCVLIAEGVDDPDTLAFLRDNKCPMYQGFLLSKGVPFAEALQMYRQSILTQNK